MSFYSVSSIKVLPCSSACQTKPKSANAGRRARLSRPRDKQRGRGKKERDGKRERDLRVRGHKVCFGLWCNEMKPAGSQSDAAMSQPGNNLQVSRYGIMSLQCNLRLYEAICYIALLPLPCLARG
ncbi:unnamed protein product [Pleuronectes platessa]|uniref:Uncharacterized protein n=1 Tax=Pleuronectes platessa TaxID=8262 RepID=A0A9N7VHV7_PLEPL|nr:unnamed protein product [Pleuronectes platessa]